MVLKNAKIVLIDKVIEDGYLVIENGTIISIKEGKYLGNEEFFDCNNNILMPGFIDIHTHGTVGVDFMNATTIDEYKKIESSLYKEGVTSFLATTLTASHEDLLKVCSTVAKIKPHIPSLLGIHLEGPYISKKYKGAQNENFIRNPNKDELKDYIMISKNNIRDITLAPELDGASEFIHWATANDICVSCGHSDASRDQVLKASIDGLTNVTHTTNGMNKTEGIVDAAKELNLYTEFICDGKHVSESVIKDYYKIIGPDRFVLVTDSLAVKNSSIVSFELNGVPCVNKEDACYMENGKLAGSLVTIPKAIQNMREWCGCSLVELAKISSKNAAKSLHLDKLGEIKEGFIADLVLLNEDLEVVETFKSGIRKAN